MVTNPKDRQRPEPWAAYRAMIKVRWLVPFLFIDWLADWAAYGLSRLSLLELLEYCGSFSVLVAVIFYFIEAPERVKSRHYQAWQVINTAQGQRGSGGRIDALHELNEDGVPLIGVDVSKAFLQGVRLERADLSRGTLDETDLRQAHLQHANLQLGSMRTANLRGADLSEAELSDADFYNADMTGANLRGANLHGAQMARADLRQADLGDIKNWKEISDLHLANVHDVRNSPDGFVAWALGQGAVDIAAGDQWSAAIAKADKASGK